MSSRRKHSKSRHGCSQCKASHTKVRKSRLEHPYFLTNQMQCDLAQPTCGKCMRTKKNCQFPNLVNGRSSNTLVASYGQSYPTDSPLLSARTLQGRIRLGPGTSYSAESENVLGDELELLHHFSTATYATMASREDLRRMWQIEVPKMALKQNFLMHSLFSVAALHLAWSNPRSESLYIDSAIRHHNIALHEYSFRLQAITRENSTSLFTCATLTVVFALSLAMSRPSEEPMGPIEEFLDIFMLLRGVPLVLNEMFNWIRESEIAPLFAGRELNDSIVLSDDFTNAIKLLEDRNQLMPRLDPNRETYALAIQGVKYCFKLISSKDRDNGMVLSWPVSVSKDYVALLSSRQQMALVILAHYAVILNEIKDTWWVMGWGSKLIQEVHQVVNDEWKSLLAWPMDKIFKGR